MNGWLALLNKDVRQMRAWVLAGLACDVLIGSLLVDAAYSSGRGAAVAGGLTVLWFLAHALYLPVYMLMSLAREWGKSVQIWLSLPRGGWTLLASKLISALAAMLASLFTTAAFGAWVACAGLHRLQVEAVMRGFSQANPTLASVLLTPAEFWTEVVRLAGFGALALLAFGLYAGFWISLASAGAQAVRHSLRKARWLAGLAILLIPTWGLTELQRWSVYRQAVRWGRFEVVIWAPDRLHGPVSVPLFTGQLLAFLLVLAAVYLASGWLIDRKVEV